MNSKNEKHSLNSYAAPRFGPATTANPLWRVVVVSGGLFCVSCFLWLTAGIANPDAPVNQWLNEHGVVLVMATACLVIGSAITAMAIDRSQTQRMQEDDVMRDLDAVSDVDASSMLEEPLT